MTPVHSAQILLAFVLVVCFAVIFVVLLFYCLTLFRTLQKCSPQSRTMEPWKVWLLVIPIFGLIWHFFVVLALSKSLAGEFRARNLPLPEPEPGQQLGIIMAATSVCGLLPIRFVGGLISIVSLVLWGVYWVRIARYSRFLTWPCFRRAGRLCPDRQKAVAGMPASSHNVAVRTLTLLLAAAMVLAQPAQSAAGQKPSAYENHAAFDSAEKVDLNTASLDDLMRIPGMKQSWAKRIVRHRPYYSKRALLDQGIVSAREYDRIKDFVIAHRVKKQK